jgi:hypothetical protein
MNTTKEAIHFMRSPEIRTGKRCFVRRVRRTPLVKWKIFTSEDYYMSYMQTDKRKR